MKVTQKSAHFVFELDQHGNSSRSNNADDEMVRLNI